MEQIKCTGTNENNLPLQQFQQLFIQECQKEGQIINIQVNNKFGMAVVIK